MPIKHIAIAAERLGFTRAGETLFSDFSFQIPKGSYVAIIGPNGGGKTTLLRVLLGLMKPSAGLVRLFGLPPEDPKARQRIGYVPQRGGLIDPTFPATAEEVVTGGRTQALRLLQRFKEMDKEQVSQALTMLGIERLRHRTIASLSGGERQRVLLARALAGGPDILALDEPVDGLDPESREEFYDALRRIHAQGKTILFVTHDVRRIAQEADSALCLHHEVVCRGRHACHITGMELKNIHHGTHAELAEHHGI